MALLIKCKNPCGWKKQGGRRKLSRSNAIEVALLERRKVAWKLALSRDTIGKAGGGGNEREGKVVHVEKRPKKQFRSWAGGMPGGGNRDELREPKAGTHLRGREQGIALLFAVAVRMDVGLQAAHLDVLLALLLLQLLDTHQSRRWNTREVV